MVLPQGVDVGQHQAEDDQGLEGDEAPEVVHLGGGVPAGGVRVAEVVQYDHHQHQRRVSDREYVEGRATKVLGADVEVQVALLAGLVVVVQQELVDAEEGRPVAAVGVDEEGEGAEAGAVRHAPVVEGGQEEHEHWAGGREGRPPIWARQRMIWRAAAGRVGRRGTRGSCLLGATNIAVSELIAASGTKRCIVRAV